MERCLPECFHKLLNNGAVRRWGMEIQEGIFNMVDLLTNLVIVRLKHGPVPETLLKNVYAYESYGWLMDLINLFGSQGGIELVVSRFTSGEDLDAGQMAALLLPLGQCVKFLVKEVVCPVLLPAVNQALQYVASLEEQHLRGQVSPVLFEEN
ncbi:Ubiquitin carboxyl-terminal hydrolase 24 [Chionoecetes opilio]|uniref:Ubiquitin carboxyl-terminal hydrolase 24 n=1 Tax=Chionoecetes opilio TaxID=41210 RepID=A0A8J4Y384_CHIOP|nr:Ubiquitin carboxyl-terminal hydrolase 24 [Chionoecetes opilio]